MKASIKLLLIGCILTVTGCQTRIEYTRKADSETIVYRQPLLTKRAIKSLRISGDETSRSLEVEGYQISPEFEALGKLIETAVLAAVKASRSGVAP